MWLLWGTGLTTRAAQNNLAGTFEHTHLPTVNPLPPPGWAPLPGSLYGEILIPAIDLQAYVVQGTDYESLKNGPGHYPQTANPWDPTGTVGIAGHRTTYLHPFFHLDLLKPGDTITIRTAKYGDYTYRVTKVFVLPAPVAGKVLEQTHDPTLVLTTCNPTYSSAERLIVTANRISTPSPGSQTP
ncbi:MAG: sortase [Actinomycetota bacterium]|nr:sortase [Actinomycetota bacterium]